MPPITPNSRYYKTEEQKRPLAIIKGLYGCLKWAGNYIELLQIISSFLAFSKADTTKQHFRRNLYSIKIGMENDLEEGCSNDYK